MHGDDSSRLTGVSTSPPQAGEGLHEFVLSYTFEELAKGRSQKAVWQSTWSLCRDKGRKESILRKEITDAIAGAARFLAEHPEARGARKGHGEAARRQEWGFWFNPSLQRDVVRRPPPARKWKAPVDERLIRYALGRIKQLRLRSRFNFVLDDLYAGLNFPICLAHTVDQPIALKLRDWRKKNLHDHQWMVPNPCLRCGRGGGVKSYQNAGERIWLIVEFDRYTLEEQARLLSWLDRRGGLDWRLAMIVYSGSKSLHGWFSCVGKDEDREIISFFKLATRLGCDRAMQSSVQYTRFPLGFNFKTERRQEIIHWNEQAFSEHNERLEDEYLDLGGSGESSERQWKR